MGTPNPLAEDTIRITVQLEVPYKHDLMNYGEEAKKVLEIMLIVISLVVSNQKTDQVKLSLKENSMDKVKEWVKYFLHWHEEFMGDFRWKFNLSHYQIMWIAYFEGIATVLILQWIF